MQIYTERFTLRLSPRDVKILAELAQAMDRTESDALRSLARKEYEAMKNQPGQQTTQPTKDMELA